MHGSAPLQPLITPPPPQPRQNKQGLLIAGGVVVVGAVAAIIFTMSGPKVEIRRERAERPIPEASAVGAPSLPPADLRMQTTYAGARLPKAMPQLVTSTPAAASPNVPFTPVSVPTTPVRTEFLPPEPPPRLPPPPAMTAMAPARPAPTPAPAPVPQKKEEPRRWFAPAQQAQSDLMAAPFPEKDKEQEGKESKLFPKAQWETPSDPTKVLYADQLVHGLLMQDINSEIPGTIRMKVTQDVQDRWGQGNVLIPMDTTILGRQQGNTSHGQTLIPITVYMGILPTGTAIAFDDGQVGTAGGAIGVPGKVNGHYGKLILGAGLQALLNIGVRAPFGSPGQNQYQPNLAQEYSQDVAQSVGQSMQKIVERELQVRPTITQQHSYPVTISFSKNVSFQTKPVVVNK